MGGFVSCYYPEVLERWRDCWALFIFETSYRSLVNAVFFLANGLRKAIFDLIDVIILNLIWLIFELKL